MSEKPKSATVEEGVESPTTARPLEWDDDEIKDTTTLDSPPPKPARSPKPGVRFAEEEAPPPKPPRPMSPQAQAEATLIEAFPSIDTKVVKAVLVASQYKVEPAFNALLSMSDPDFHAEPEQAPPPQPPRPTHGQSQLDADERYARQLAAHYESAEGYGAYGSQSRGDPPMPRHNQRGQNLKPNELYDDKEHSFFDDDLPVIKESIKKGFIETQSTVNKWLTDFRKKLDGEDDDADYERRTSSQQRQDFGPSHQNQLYGIRRSTEARRSNDIGRYDADPRVLGDDFTALELRDDEAPPRKPNRPLANPDLFKPTPAAPQSGPVDEVEAIYRGPSPVNRQKSPNDGKGPGKKWQPLTAVAPNPEPEDHDPFSLGDSDEEEAKTKDIRAEDTERLKKAAAESGNKETGSGPKLQPAERSGSIGQKDKEVEQAMANS